MKVNNEELYRRLFSKEMYHFYCFYRKGDLKVSLFKITGDIRYNRIRQITPKWRKEGLIVKKKSKVYYQYDLTPKGQRILNKMKSLIEEFQ